MSHKYKGLSKDQMGDCKQHWEFHYSNEPQKDTKKRIGAEFSAHRPKDRMNSHVRVNETDT